MMGLSNKLMKVDSFSLFLAHISKERKNQIVPLMSTTSSVALLGHWTPQQYCYRSLLKGLREAYFHDRSKLFWARHRARIEFYKYSRVEDEEAIKQLVGVGNEIAAFVSEHMRTTVDRIVRHNEKMMSLPVAEAKRFRQEFMLKEKQHDSWCKQKIKAMMQRRPPAPYPFC